MHKHQRSLRSCELSISLISISRPSDNLQVIAPKQAFCKISQIISKSRRRFISAVVVVRFALSFHGIVMY